MEPKKCEVCGCDLDADAIAEYGSAYVCDSCYENLVDDTHYEDDIEGTEDE